MRAKEHHERVMRLLIRRYVTAEQRTRDEYGITEDDVMEIRQDISSLRYELIDILHQNGMKTPTLTKDVQCKKGIVFYHCSKVGFSGRQKGESHGKAHFERLPHWISREHFRANARHERTPRHIHTIGQSN